MTHSTARQTGKLLFTHRFGAFARTSSTALKTLAVVGLTVLPGSSADAQPAPQPAKPARVQPLLDLPAKDAGNTAPRDGATIAAGARPEPSPSDAEAPADKGAESAAPFTLAPLASGISKVVQFALAPYPQPKPFVATRDGKILSLNDAAEGKAQPILDLRGRLAEGGDSGLVGFAFHPQFIENHRIFVHIIVERRGERLNRISEFTADSAVADLNNDTEKIILEFAQPNPTHVGGQIVFGPDGMLYIGVGDGGGKNDPKGRGQSRNDLYGAILRIDVNETPYLPPPTNPFVSSGDGMKELWAIGFRNPTTLSFDSKKRLFAGDSGGPGAQEVNAIEMGANYGWSIMDGDTCLGMRIECMNQKYRAPLTAYEESEESAVIVGPVYEGELYPALTGKLIYADRPTGRIFTVDPDGGTPELLLASGRSITALGRSASGELYVADDGKGEVLMLRR